MLCCSLFFFFIGRSQEFSYSHYTTRDGLASKVVYCMQQDTDGFMWFGTEAGVSRFDGTNFKTFTMRDGLPDNAILRLFADSRGRVWIMPFKNSICYYYKGKIHTQENDSLLAKIRLTDFVMGCVETGNGEIVIIDKKMIWAFTPEDKVTNYQCPRSPECYLTKLVNQDTKEILMMDEQQVYATKDFKQYHYLFNIPAKQAGEGTALVTRDLVCWYSPGNMLHVRSLRYKIEYEVPVPSLNTILKLDDSLLCLNTSRGSFIFNILTRQISEHFLSNRNVSNCFTDNEGGVWYSTITDGVYRLRSRRVKNFRSLGAGEQNFHVFELQKDRNAILVGTDMGCMELKTDETGAGLSLSEKFDGASFNKPIKSVIIRGDTHILGSGPGVFVSSKGAPFRSAMHFGAIKQMDFLNDRELVLATSGGLLLIDFPSLRCTKVLREGRTTSMLIRRDSIFFGTLTGLLIRKPDGMYDDLGDQIPFLKGRKINAIREASDGTIWVAAFGGIVEIRNHEMGRVFGTNNGLSSEDCRTLVIDRNCIWVGTDKGLDRVFIDPPGSIIHYSTTDGLGSNMINTLLVNGNYLYAGTPEGVSFFNKSTINTNSRCDLRLLNVSIDGAAVAPAVSYALDYNKRNIRFDYVGISYRSEGDIEYTYRLRGFDTAWHRTRQTSLDFIALPAGDYELELFATNKFGVESKPLNIAMLIKTPFWQTAWFITLSAILLMGLTWMLVTERSKRIREREKAAQAIQEKLQDLEQKALRAQMNPHFIFNSLNSIQGFILDNDAGSANKYLSSFARLIRQTLDNSAHSEISVEDEINYLVTYLQLEQLRFKHSFNYSVKADPEVNKSQTFIPGMVLQPFVENAIRHGIQNRQQQGGFIQVGFSLCQDWLCCTITDNGPGREVVQALKSSQHIEYQSRGMQLTTERINVLNLQQKRQISLEMEDVLDEAGNVSGTRIIVKFPVNH
ncbi:two component regulator with propeller domain [Pseudobacter ginsenosidimutans]|uniref:Two component regulator with propeller domain n=2 Tax=Pseudobacter ginsenosidimutans TaxID=661488 RepID=A0A4Q7MZS3_9BACT|nr:two component regulator with propeller domain [Pseudobacter ginsenosidimutans]